MKCFRWIDSGCCHVLRTMNIYVIIFLRVSECHVVLIYCLRIESIVKYLRQIDSSLLSRFRDEKHSCIITSWVLTSGGVDWLSANQVEYSNASDELIQFGCIGHGCKPLCYCFIKLQFWTSWWYVSFLLIMVLVFNSAVLYVPNSLIFLYAMLLKHLQWFLV